MAPGQGRDILSALYHQAATTPQPLSGKDLPEISSTITWPKHLAILQQIDMERLVTAAQASGTVIALHVVPGAVLTRGTPIADVHGAALPASDVLDGLVTGTERTLEQDPLMAIRLLADIVMRAMSAAINDPATAIQGLDCLEDLLSGFPAEQTGPLHVGDHAGGVRVIVRLPDLGDFLRTGLDGVIPAAATSPLVLLRLHTLLTHLKQQGRTHDQDLITRRMTWVEGEMATRFPLIWDEHTPDAHSAMANPPPKGDPS